MTNGAALAGELLNSQVIKRRRGGFWSIRRQNKKAEEPKDTTRKGNLQPVVCEGCVCMICAGEPQ